ncbi:hypothetical protein D9M68_100240 [compost metagenome]
MARRICRAISRTITLETALCAIRAYNSGTYRGEPNVELDRRARQKFANGLARTLEGIYDQIRFVGADYGGVSGYQAALRLTETIALEIYMDLDAYRRCAEGAPPLIEAPSAMETIEFLYKPFCKPLNDKQNWLVWASKFWHFLNPDAFPIGDSRVYGFFGLSGWPNCSYKYVELLQNFRKFALDHQKWIESLREADSWHAWSDNKLWDKVFYGLLELDDSVVAH